MGRSVDYLSRAEHVAYINNAVDNDETTDYFIARENWNWFKEGLVELLQKRCPSLEEVDEWDGRETHIFLENLHAQIGLSEYCGLVSLSIRINDTNFRCNGQLAFGWINQVWPKILTDLDKRYHTLTKLGSFSNGEGVFQKKQIELT